MREECKGRVIRAVGGHFEILGEDGRRFFCRARGVLRRGDDRVLVGDAVTLALEEGEAVIESREARRNELIRPPLSNLDCLYAVLAVADPAPITETTDKLLAILEHEGIPAAVVLTKADLSSARAEELAAVYCSAGYPVFIVSAHTGAGLDALRAHLSATLAGGHTAAFAGASGVGKSSLCNALFPALTLETGEISRKIGRGKNTTRHVELYPVFGGAENGFLADTPGFSMLDFVRFDFMRWDELPAAFREFRPLISQCRYGNCRHIKEEDCAIRIALREGRIAPSRYESYASLYDVLRRKNPYTGEH